MGTKRRKKTTNADRAMAKRLNSTVVSKYDLMRANEEVNKLSKDERDFEGIAITIARLYSGTTDKAQAIYFRMEALARLLESCDGKLQPWALPKQDDGAVLTSEVVFAVAAVQPLVSKDGELTFERASFMENALGLAEVDGEA